MLLKRKQQDFKDREYDSDDDLRKEMLTYDDRLTFVNKIDSKLFNSTKKDLDQTSLNREKSLEADAETDQTSKLPIVFHEREIMENIENFLVTIVCGETGSGKST